MTQTELMEVINAPMRSKEVAKAEHRVRKPVKKAKVAAA